MSESSKEKAIRKVNLDSTGWWHASRYRRLIICMIKEQNKRLGKADNDKDINNVYELGGELVRRLP